jgi:hypothetical protein
MSPYTLLGGIGIALPGIAIIVLLITGSLPSRRSRVHIWSIEEIIGLLEKREQAVAA